MVQYGEEAKYGSTYKRWWLYSVGGTLLPSVDLFTILVNSTLNFFAFTLGCGELGHLESRGSLLKGFDENPLNLAQA